MDRHAESRPAATDSPSVTVLDGNAVAARLRTGLEDCVETLEAAGVTPGLATVLMTEGGTGRTYASMKQRACSELGIRSQHHEIDPDAPAAALFDRIDELNADPAVHGISVQTPLPDHVGGRAAIRRIDPAKDVEGVHPENLGRLLAGTPRYKPCTAHGIQRLLSAYGVETEGKRAVVVGRSETVGAPTANLLFGRGHGGDATTTVCHSSTEDLGSVTRTADVLVVAAGEPELVDAGMLSAGVTVVDVGINRVDVGSDTKRHVVGDVDFESATQQASAISPVPGGVGPLTTEMLLYNVVSAARGTTGVDVDLP